jgi:ABC-type multidrug transport system fused ATPase/permease subunit
MSLSNQDDAKIITTESFMTFLSTARWVLGKKHTTILILASFTQIIFALLDIVLLALVGPLMISTSGQIAPESKYLILGKLTISTEEILLFIVLTVLVKNIAGLVVQRFVMNSLATRQAEVGTALVQASFFDQSENRQNLNSTNLLHTITSITSSLFGSFFRPMIAFVGEIATLCAVIIGMLIINIQVAILSICYFYLFGHLLIRFIGQEQRILGKNALATGRDSLRSFSEIQIMNRELRLAHKDLDALITLNRFRTTDAKIRSSSVFLSVIPRYLFEIIFLLGIGALVIYLENFQEDKKVLPILALVIAAGYRILPSLNYITTNMGQFKNSLASLEHIDSMSYELGLRSTNLKFNQNRNLQQKIRFRGDLYLEHVSYQYPISKKMIFTDFNLVVKSGETLLIQGISGTGKTTLISLATGSFSPDRGRIFTLYGDQEFAMDKNVTGISYLSQDVPLLDESFAYNIALEVTTEKDLPRLRDAAAKAGILDRILQSGTGFNTQVGENGALLSAGERQRLGIARSLYSQPALLILDEPTANLDAVSEKLIWDTLIRIKGQLTILIVSHRVVPESLYDRAIQLPLSR